jgi:hypothetical protein
VMSGFPWDKDDVEKFKKIFKGVDVDIKAGDIPRKNSFKRAGRTRPKVKDFEQLMRLVVKDKSARVKQGIVGSKRYRIQMISDDYPYVQNIFDDVVFKYNFWLKPMPEPEDLLKRLPKGTKWDEGLQQKWESTYLKAEMFGYALEEIYIYHGFDLDYLFEIRIDNDGRSVSTTEWQKELWALDIQRYISMYEAFSYGRNEIFNEFGFDHNMAFLTAYRYNFIRSVLSAFWYRSHTKKIVPSKYAREAVTLWETGQPIPEELVRSMYRGNVIDDSFGLAAFTADGNKFVPVLEGSTDPTVVKYCNRWRTAHADLIKLYLQRNNK